MVALDLQVYELVAFSQVDQVVDLLSVVLQLLLFELDFSFEVARCLKLIPQIPLAFDQKVAVNGVLFVNRNILLQLFAGNLAPDRLDIDGRTGVDVQGRCYAAGIAIIVHGLEMHARHEPLVLLVSRTNVVHALARARLGNGPPAADEATFPPGGGYNLCRRHFQVSGYDGRLVLGTWAALNNKVNVCLLRSGVIVYARL